MKRKERNPMPVYFTLYILLAAWSLYAEKTTAAVITFANNGGLSEEFDFK